MQVIGLMRFSYPALGGFQTEHTTHDSRTQFLYDRARMAVRLHYLEKLCLPSLRAQTDPDFTLIILVGNDLPMAFADRLHRATAFIRQVVFEIRPPGPHRRVCQEVINKHRRNPNEPCIQFRMDDDDAVAVDFIARLRAAAYNALPDVERHRQIAVDFNQGFIGRLKPLGIRVAPFSAPLQTAGLGMLVAPRHQLTIMNFAHHKMAQFMPVRTYDDAPMFIRSQHAHNDAANENHAPELRDPDDLLRDQLRDRFALEWL